MEFQLNENFTGFIISLQMQNNSSIIEDINIVFCGVVYCSYICHREGVKLEVISRIFPFSIGCIRRRLRLVFGIIITLSEWIPVRWMPFVLILLRHSLYNVSISTESYISVIRSRNLRWRSRKSSECAFG